MKPLLYLINEGETLKFNETSRTSRVYLAVGGGFKLEKISSPFLSFLPSKPPISTLKSVDAE
jgi:hypothetical protein